MRRRAVTCRLQDLTSTVAGPQTLGICGSWSSDGFGPHMIPMHPQPSSAKPPFKAPSVLPSFAITTYDPLFLLKSHELPLYCGYQRLVFSRMHLGLSIVPCQD